MTEMVRAEAGALAVRLDPQALLMEAVKGKASIDTLERIMALAERHQANQAKSAWHESMASFQQECPPITKSSTAKIRTARAEYSYSYAALDEIMPVIRPVLGKYGLSVSWSHRIEPNQVIADCVVSHILGHQERSGEIAMPIGGDNNERMNPAQRVGSAITYAKRYSLIAALGLAPEDDDDAHAQDSATVDKDTGEVLDEAPRMPTCPACGKDRAVMAGKAEYGGGWLCFKKKGGCGHKWQDAPIIDAAVLDAKEEAVEPSAFDQNIEDRRRLIEQIGVDRKYLGLTDAQWTVMWAKTVGPNVSEQAAPLDKLVALGANLADKVSDMKREQA
jgi:hypothetical protein